MSINNTPPRDPSSLSPSSMEPVKLHAHKNNPSSIDPRRRHDGRLDGDVKQPVRHLVTNGKPTGYLPINDERTEARIITSAMADAPPKSPKELSAMIRRKVQRAVETICLSSSVPTDGELTTLDRCAGILAKMERLEPPMTAEEYEAAERTKRDGKAPA